MAQAPIQISHVPAPIPLQPIPSAPGLIEQGTPRIGEVALDVLRNLNDPTPPALCDRLCDTIEECRISTQICFGGTLVALFVGTWVAGILSLYNMHKEKMDYIPFDQQAKVIIGMGVLAGGLGCILIDEYRRRGICCQQA